MKTFELTISALPQFTKPETKEELAPIYDTFTTTGIPIKELHLPGGDRAL